MSDNVWDDIEASTEDKVPRDRWGRPLIVPPGAKPGTKPVPYTRATTFADSVEDMYGLGRWQQRMVALGLAKRPDLLLAVSAHEDDKDKLNRLTDQAKEAAASSAAATTGTALHKLAERYNHGQISLDDVPDSNRADLAAYVAATAPLTLHGIEEFVVVDELQVGGTFDRIVEYDGKRYVADIKTGSIEYASTKMSIQLALYAHGELYTPGKGDRGSTGVSRTSGIIIHLPAGAGRCDLYWIDLRAGWEAAELCQRVRAWRKRKGLLAAASFGQAVLEPPVSETDRAVAVVEEVFEVINDNAEAVKLLIADADSSQQLEQIWAAHQQHWTAEHTRLAAARKTHLHQRSLRAVSA